MNKTIMGLLLCMFFQLSGNAQKVKLSFTQGLGINLKKSKDSIFFAKSYLASQLRLGYHIGKLGLISNTTLILQKNELDEPDDLRVPVFVRQNRSDINPITTILTTLGLELCIPIIRKRAQLNLYTSYGIGISMGVSSGFYNVDSPLYVHKVSRKTTGSMQHGISFNYKISPTTAIKWQNELAMYKLPFDGFDERKLPSNYTETQSKLLFITSVGLQLTF